MSARDAWEDAAFAQAWDSREHLRTNPDRPAQLALLHQLLRSSCGEGSRLLDLGIGSGQVEAFLVNADPTFFAHRRVVGIDASAAMLALASARFRSESLEAAIALLETDFRDLDRLELDAPFDGAFCVQALHEVDHGTKRRVFRFVRGVLRDNAPFYVLDRFGCDLDTFAADCGALWEGMRRRCEPALEVPDFDGYRALYDTKADFTASIADYENWLHEAGFAATCLYSKFNRALIAARPR